MAISQVPVPPAAFTFTRVQEFNSSGNFVHPDGASANSPKPVAVVCIGGGGGGQGAWSNNAISGGGGGGGGVAGNPLIYVTGTVSVTVGAGGTAGVGSNTTTAPTSAGAGGTSSFGNFVSALGGQPSNARAIYEANASPSQWPVWGGNGSSGGGAGGGGTNLNVSNPAGGTKGRSGQSNPGVAGPNSSGNTPVSWSFPINGGVGYLSNEIAVYGYNLPASNTPGQSAPAASSADSLLQSHWPATFCGGGGGGSYFNYAGGVGGAGGAGYGLGGAGGAGGNLNTAATAGTAPGGGGGGGSTPGSNVLAAGAGAAGRVIVYY